MSVFQLPKHLHPDFAIPNKQPLGEVEIDWSNPLTRGLVGVYLFGKAGENLVTKERFNANTSISAANNKIGRSNEFASNSNYPSGNKLNFNNNEASLIVHGFNLENSGTTYTGLVGYKASDAATDQGWALSYFSTTDLIYWTSRNGGTYSDDTTRIDMSQVTGEKLLSVRVDNASGTKTVDYNLNNIFRTQGTSGSADWLNITSGDQFYIGDANDTNTGQLNTVVMYNRRLTDAEDSALQRDLYQILKPKTPYLYLAPSGGSGAYTLTANSGSYTLTGTPATLSASRKLSAASGAFNLSGTAASFARGYALAASTGSYTLSGTAASLKASRKLTASSGTYNLTGTAANLTYTPATGAYSLIAESGSYALSGTSANLAAGRKIAASSGSYALSGTAATLSRGYTLAAGSGTYTLTGAAAAFTLNRAMVAASGGYTLTGTNATFTYSGAGAQIIASDWIVYSQATPFSLVSNHKRFTIQ